MESEAYRLNSWHTDTYSELGKEDIEFFWEYMDEVQEKFLDDLIEIAPVPSRVNRCLSTEHLRLEISTYISFVEEDSDVVDASELKICISEVENCINNPDFDYILISHTVYEKRNQLNYKISHYLINDIEGTKVKVVSTSQTTNYQKQSFTNHETAFVSDIDSDELLTRERLGYLMQLVDTFRDLNL